MNKQKNCVFLFLYNIILSLEYYPGFVKLFIFSLYQAKRKTCGETDRSF